MDGIANPIGRAVSRRLFLLMLPVFFGGGMLNAAESLLVPRLKLLLDVGYARALTIQLAYYSSYLLLAFPATAIVARSGVMRATAAGTATVAAGAALLAAALGTRSFVPVLAALLLTSCGVTILQIACNGAMATFGERDRAAARFTALQGFNALGTVAGPLAAAGVLLGNGGTGAGAALLFLAFAGGFAALAIAFAHDRNLLQAEPAAVPGIAQLARLSRMPEVAGGALAIFAYVGAEVTVGTLLPSYLMLDARGGSAPADAGRLVSLYWIGAMTGRFAGAWLLGREAAATLLAGAALLAMALVAIAATPTGWIGAVAMIAIGLANSIMFPTIFALAMPPAARDVPAVAMLLCMAVVGGAIVPVATGAIADRFDLSASLLLPLACYAVILAYARARRRA